MKKFYNYILFIFILFSLFIALDNKSKCKVFDILTPTEIYVDLNKNLIFDEKEPIKITNISYINANDNIFEELTNEEKFFFNYQAKKVSQFLLQDKFVQIEDGEIIIDGEKYTNLLLRSGFFYEIDNKNSINKLSETIKKYNIDDYLLYNIQTKKFHNINCKNGQKSKKFKIIKKSEAENFVITCNCGTSINAKPILKEEKNLLNKYEKGNIKVFFMDLNEKYIPSFSCDTSACISLKNEIDNAQSSIDFAIYGINKQPKIFNALVNAQNRGVKIRWVTDFNKKDKNYYEDTEKLKKIIKSYNTDEQTDLISTAALMHNKFFIFDNKKVFTGSANITSTDLGGFNSNISVLIDSKEIANIYKKEFEQMYSGKFHKDKEKIENKTVFIRPDCSIQVFFSPQDKPLTTQLLALINNAKQYIYIPIFFITKNELINSLANAHKRGVEIKIINDATNAGTKHSIHKKLRECGISVKTENYAGKMHSKAMIIDDEISVIGSMNFSNSGEKRNDENMLIIKDKEITRYLKSTFLQLWNKIPQIYETKDPRAESYQSIGSCFDGIDNDFDGKIDDKDSGCFVKYQF